jgi:hypothetical protein
VLSIIEKSSDDQAAIERARKEEEDRLATQEKIYQVWTFFFSN